MAKQARRSGYFDCLRVNTDGAVVEGAVSNVFFVLGGASLTPSLSTGALPGVVREHLLTRSMSTRVSLGWIF